MCPTLSAVYHWLRTNEQSLAIWIEGLALVAIFVLELIEYKRQGKERKEQHEESAAQMKIAQDAANAAKASADAVLSVGLTAMISSLRRIYTLVPIGCSPISPK